MVDIGLLSHLMSKAVRYLWMLPGTHRRVHLWSDSQRDMFVHRCKVWLFCYSPPNLPLRAVACCVQVEQLVLVWLHTAGCAGACVGHWHL